jgi:hypothetical protein
MWEAIREAMFEFFTGEFDGFDGLTITDLETC